LNRTSQEILRYLSGSSTEISILSQNCASIMSILLLSSTGNQCRNRMLVPLDLTSFFPHTSNTSTNNNSTSSTPSTRYSLSQETHTCFKRCGVGVGSRKIWVHPETISYMGVDPLDFEGDWSSGIETGRGVSFHHNLQRFAGVTLCEMSAALPNQGSLLASLRAGVRMAAQCTNEHYYTASELQYLLNTSTITQKKSIKEHHLLHLMTPPLRSMIFADQIQAKMWERNGSAEMRQQHDNVSVFFLLIQ
jgi:hypothetical protein